VLLYGHVGNAPTSNRISKMIRPQYPLAHHSALKDMATPGTAIPVRQPDSLPQHRPLRIADQTPNLNLLRLEPAPQDAIIGLSCGPFAYVAS